MPHTRTVLAIVPITLDADESNEEIERILTGLAAENMRQICEPAGYTFDETTLEEIDRQNYVGVMNGELDPIGQPVVALVPEWMNPGLLPVVCMVRFKGRAQRNRQTPTSGGGFPIEAGPLRLYAPQPGTDRWSVADDGFGWLPGTYDTRETATAAAELPIEVLEHVLNPICHIDGENRAINMVDVLKAGDAALVQIDREPYRCDTAGCTGHTNPTAICPKDLYAEHLRPEDWDARAAARRTINFEATP